MEVKGKSGSRDIPYRDIDKGRPYVPEIALVWGDELRSKQFEDRIAKVIKEPVDGNVLLLTEIEGATAQDLNREKGVIPSNPDHEFSLQGFPHGVTVHAWTNGGYPDDEQMKRAIDEQVSLNRNLEEQVLRAIPDDERAAYRQSMGTNPSLARRILQGMEMTTGLADTIDWCYGRADGRVYGGLDVPSAIFYEYRPNFEWKHWETRHSQIIGGTHFVRVQFRSEEVEIDDELIEEHLSMWARMVAYTTDMAALAELP